MAFAGGKLRSSSHSGSSASGEKRRPRSTASSTSTAARGLARRIRDPDRPTLNTPGSVAASSPAVQSSPGGVRQASRSRSPEANAPVQDLTDRIVSQIMSRRLVQESDMEDLRFNVMSILQPALKKSSFEETQRLSIELQEARSRTAHARTEIARLKSEAQTLEQKSVEAEEKGRRAETRASKAEARLKSSLQDPLMIKVGSETVEVRSSTSRAKDTMEVLAEEQRKMEKELHQLKSKADTNKSATIRVVTQLIGYNNNRLNNLLQAAVFGLWRTTAKERFSQKQAKTQQAQEEEARKKRQLHGDAKAKFIATLVEGKRKQLVFAQCLRAWSQLVYENHLETARHKQEEQHKEEFKQLKSKADRNMLATSERMAMQLDRMALQLMSRDTDQVLAAVVGSWKIATQEGKFLRQQAAEKHKMQQEISQLQSKAERNMLASSERTATQRISPTEGHEAEKEEPAAAAKKEEEPEAPAKKKREVEALKEKSEAAEKPKMQQAIDLPAQTEEKPVEAEEESRRAETRASKAEAPQVETVLDLDEKDEDASIRMVEAPSSTSRAKDAAVRRKQEEQQKEEAQLTASKSASSERTATQRISPAEGHEAEKEEPAAAAKKEEEPEATAKKKREAEALKQKLEEEQLLRQQAAERHKLQEEATAEKKREAEALKQKLEEEQLLRQQAAERHKLQQEATAEKRREAEALKQKLEEEQLLRQQAAEKHKLQQEATAEKEREAEALKQKLEEEQLLRQQAEKEEPAAAAKKVDKPEAEKKEPAAAAEEEEEGEETEATAEKRREAEALKLEEEQLLRQQAAEKHKLQQEATAAKKREAEALKQKLEEEQLLRQQAAEKHKLQEEATAEKKREAEALKQKLEEEQLLRQQAAEKQAEEKRKVDKELHQLKSRADTNMVATMNRVVTQLIGQDNNLLQVAVFGWWRTAAKEENLSRKQANAQQAHEEEVRQMRQLHGDAKDKFMATLVEGRRKILLFNSARQCLTAWNQLAYENHLETVRQKQEEQHKEEFNKFKYKADRYMLVTRDRMAMQLISHDTDQVLAAVVGSWKTATQEGKFLRQQAAEKYKMQQEFNKFQSKADRNMLVTRERMAMQLIGHDASHVLAAVVGSWKMALKEGRLLRQQATEKHKMQQDLNLFKSKAEKNMMVTSHRMAMALRSHDASQVLAAVVGSWKTVTKDEIFLRQQAAEKLKANEEFRQFKSKAEKNMMVTSHRMAMALISHDASQVLAAVVGSWKTVTKDEIFLRQQAAEKLKANEELRQFKSKAEKNMMVTRDRMALQLIGQQKSHVLAAVVGLWKTVTKDGKLSRQQAERERLHKIEMARVDGLWKKAANDKAFRAAARFFQNHLGGLLLDIFLQWSIWVEVSRREKKVEEANQAHEEEVRKMRQVHGDRRARLIATTVQGRERMLLFSSLKHCLRAWSQLVFESHVETVRHEQDQKHREELNGVKGLLKHHCKQNAFYALLSKELGKNQLILQHAIGVWKEFRAEQVVQSIYEEKIAKLTTQFEDDAAELMHVQSLKIYSLKMALAEVKAKSHRKLLIQYCLQKWDDCKYQRQLEDKLMQVNEKHEDELAELVHAQGLTKHRLRSLMQERFLTGVIRQELQRHFLAWSHVKRLVASTAAELLLVAKAKQQLEKDMKVRKLKAFRTKERVVSHTGKNIDFIRLKDLWLAWWVQVIAHRFEVQQKSLKKLHGEEIRRLRAEALQEQQALGERMHRELEQVGRKAYLRELLSQWQIVVKKLRSHRSFHQEMDQIRKEAQVEVIKKEERTVERLSMVAVHSAELPVRRRAKEKRSSSPAVGHCPTCRAEMHLADLHPQQALRSLLDELPVSCPHGCGWTGRRDALKAHQAPGPGQCIRMQEEIAFLTEAQLEAHVAEQDEQATW